MPREIWNRVLKQAAKGFQGYPIAIVAYYGPNASKATKVVVAIIPSEGADADHDRSDPLRLFAQEIEEVGRDDAPAAVPEFAFFTDEQGAH